MFSGKVLFSLTFFSPIIFYFSFSSPRRTVTAEATLEVPEADFYFFPLQLLSRTSSAERCRGKGRGREEEGGEGRRGRGGRREEAHLSYVRAYLLIVRALNMSCFRSGSIRRD